MKSHAVTEVERNGQTILGNLVTLGKLVRRVSIQTSVQQPLLGQVRERWPRTPSVSFVAVFGIGNPIDNDDRGTSPENSTSPTPRHAGHGQDAHQDEDEE